MENIKIAIADRAAYLNPQRVAEALTLVGSAFGENEVKRINGINNEKARAASLGGLMALLTLVGERGGVICRGENGKPYFNDTSCGYFSISHSGALSVAAYGTCELGVDVELIDNTRDYDRIAKRFFTERELKRFEQGGADAECFFEIWTEKEAYIKYLGGSFAALCSSDSEGVSFKRFFFERDGGKYIITLCLASDAKAEQDISLAVL